LPIFGGTTTRLYNLLLDRINEHYLYIPQAPSRYIPDNIGMLKSEETFGNIKLQRCSLFEHFKVEIPLIKTFRYGKINSDKLVSFVKEKNIEIVHGHNPLEFAIAAMKYAKKYNIPFVYEAHGLMVDKWIIKKKSCISMVNYLLVKELLKIKEKKIFQSADAVITQTNAMKQRIKSVYSVDVDKIKIIPNGVDEDKFDPAKWYWQGVEIRKKRKWNKKIIFMYSGYLDNINGIKFFIENVKIISEEIKQKIKVVILGRGPLQKYVENMSKEESWLEYIGLVNYDDMPIYYSACDVFVIPRPSTLPAETLVPMKLLEAMAMEKVVLGTDVRGITEIITNNKNGVLFKNGNKDDFLSKIDYIVKNYEKSNNLGKQAGKDVLNIYKWQISKRKLQGLYLELASKSRMNLHD
jgi:glycosyltransferase involved in cell wall biosynthesis